MYLRSIQRRNLDGSVVRYLQLAHNEWDPATKQARAKVIHSFGREDSLDRDAIHRLIKSLTRALDPAQALTLTENAELAFVDSRPLGGAWTLDHLWRRLGIRASMERLLTARRLHPRTERVLFALVANRALKPLSKLAATTWVANQVAIDGLETVDDETCYRAMDWLLQVEAELSEAIYFSVADLLNLEVDLLFFDTTSTYFERSTSPTSPNWTTRDAWSSPASAPTVTPRTTGPICPRSWSAWRSPVRASPSGSGSGPATPLTPPSSNRCATTCGHGS